MTNQPPRELFTSERPVRSDFSRERSYARRRTVTLGILALVIGGTTYAFWNHGPANPADIPTIKAEGAYKQKPADPGGIDIPHQDVRVYDELENKAAPSSQVEHLLPPPETPKTVPHAAAPEPVPAIAETLAPQTPTPYPAPQLAAVPPAPPPKSAPISLIDPTPRPLKTTVAPTVAAAVPIPAPAASVAAAPVAPVPASTIPSAPIAALAATPPKPVAPTPPASIDQIIANTKSLTAAPHASPAAGSVSVQLASLPDESKANDMMLNLKEKYASALSGVTLHLVRADLGAKGIYYRIQSQGLTEEGANHICSSLKQMNAGCILVRK